MICLKIPAIKYKQLSQDKQLQLILTDIDVACYVKKISNKLPALYKHNVSKNAQDKYDKIKGIYTLPIGIVMVENSRYIGTC